MDDTVTLPKESLQFKSWLNQEHFSLEFRGCLCEFSLGLLLFQKNACFGQLEKTYCTTLLSLLVFKTKPLLNVTIILLLGL